MTSLAAWSAVQQVVGLELGSQLQNQCARRRTCYQATYPAVYDKKLGSPLVVGEHACQATSAPSGKPVSYTHLTLPTKRIV